MKIALTADLHWNVSTRGDRNTRRLADRVVELNPEILVLVGDTGVEEEMAKGLALFREFKGAKLLVAGNHCLWCDRRSPNSLEIYQKVIVETAEYFGFHYLDKQPWLAADHSFAIVGNISWYDYSYASPVIAVKYPDCQEIYRRKEFLNGWHNDGRYVRLGMSDADFTRLVLAKLKNDLDDMSRRAEMIVAAIHHPPYPELFYPLRAKPSDDDLIWLAYTSNRAIADLLPRYLKLRYVFCGHTHFARHARIGQIHAYNIGGNYHWKRLALLDLVSNKVEFQEFR